MKTIFDPASKKEIEERLNKLTSQTKPQWGKMNAAQMLTHCGWGLQVPAGDFTIKPTFIRFIGRFFKNMAINDKPFTKNSPTAAELYVKDERDFDKEKKNFLAAFSKISAGESAVKVFRNAFFGPLTAAEWGLFLYKHTDHHFRQFGV